MKNGCLVQLHMHTADTSKCGESSAADMARACKDAGYDAIAITDHFINANIGCDKDLPWEEKVAYQFRGYYAAREVGEKIGLTVLKAWEAFRTGPEYLTYGLDEEFLLANPDIADVTHEEYMARVKAAGGFIIHAHPFRRYSKHPPFETTTDGHEAFEVFNACNIPEENAPALEMAKKANLIMTAGCDGHAIDEIFGGAMLFERDIRTESDLIDALRARDGKIIEDVRDFNRT